MAHKILVVGSGGREHALAKKLNESRYAQEVYCAPGNVGMTELGIICVDITATDIDGLIAFVQKEGISFTVVGPEAPLAMGIVNRFTEAGLKIFGPTQEATKLESSKIFAKMLMTDPENNIPTAKFAVFFSIPEVYDYLRRNNFPKVIKLSGLEAGKGVCVCHNMDEATAFLNQISNGKFNSAEEGIIVEDFLRGEEASYFTFVSLDGSYLPLATAQDHKPVFDDDKGPNTGGMGAYSPAQIITPSVDEKIRKRIIEPTIAAMLKRGTPYSGTLYVGLMIDGNDDPWVVEYNARPGDPETQPIFSRMVSDLVRILIQAISYGRLQDMRVEWNPNPSVCVIMAKEGYPGDYEKGSIITGVDQANELEDVYVFHSGTATNSEGKLITTGGRVLGVTASGRDIESAISLAYGATKLISFQGMHYRTDIGRKAIGR